jgi:hypothetical protein
VRPFAPPPAALSAASYTRFNDERADAQRVDSAVVVFPFHPDDTLAFTPRLARPVRPVALSPAARRLADSLVQAVERTQGRAAARYRYQYLPAVDGRGATHVWVQGQCAPPSWWTSRTVTHKGGGRCFYRVQLDLTARRYASFSPNADR